MQKNHEENSETKEEGGGGKKALSTKSGGVGAIKPLLRKLSELACTSRMGGN